MDASLSPSSSTAHPRARHDQQTTTSKKVRLTAVVSQRDAETHDPMGLAVPAPKENHTVATKLSSSLDGLPPRALRGIAGFGAGSGEPLSGVSKTILKAVREVHLKIDTWRKYHSFFEDGFSENSSQDDDTQSILITPRGALRSGRVIAHLTMSIKGEIKIGRIVNTSHPIHVGEFSDAFKKFISLTLRNLRSIKLNTKGERRPVMEALVPHPNHYVVAPKLTRVVLQGHPTLVVKAGKAINAGLWPALEELNLSHCRANVGYFCYLESAIKEAKATKLRLLNWDKQAEVRKRRLDDVVLSALASGQCPLIESLSFTKNPLCPEYRIDKLGDALRACPNLRVLEMDCSRFPGRDLQTVTSALEAGDVPHLQWVFLRSTKEYKPRDKTREGVQALRRAASQRENLIEIHTDIKTCHSTS